MKPVLRLACLSDPGRRSQNQDNFWFFGTSMPAEHQGSETLVAEVPLDGEFAVGLFDGMGGESGGEIASAVAAVAFGRHADDGAWSVMSLCAVMDDLDAAVQRKRGELRMRSMGTTATLLAGTGVSHVLAANVGDSPALLCGEGGLRKLSVAHTDASMLHELGIPDRKPALTQYLGMAVNGLVLSPHVASVDLQPEEKILLATDGLTDALAEEEIADIMQMPGDVRETADLLRDRALERGADDNITVIVCAFSNGSSKAGVSS